MAQNLVEPWEHLRKWPKSRHFKYFWSSQWDKLAQKRSKLYKRYKRIKDWIRRSREVHDGREQPLIIDLRRTLKARIQQNNLELSLSAWKQKRTLSGGNLSSQRKIEPHEFIRFIVDRFITTDIGKSHYLIMESMWPDWMHSQRMEPDAFFPFSRKEIHLNRQTIDLSHFCAKCAN